jgi:hypothetical protein
VLGSEPQQLEYDNFKLSVAVSPVSPTSPGFTVTTPLSSAEALTGKKPSSVDVQTEGSDSQSGALVSKVVVVYPRSYTADPAAYVSNPVMLQLAGEDGSVNGLVGSVYVPNQQSTSLPHALPRICAPRTSRTFARSPVPCYGTIARGARACKPATVRR